jgi:hypothetical protein
MARLCDAKIAISQSRCMLVFTSWWYEFDIVKHFCVAFSHQTESRFANLKCHTTEPHYGKFDFQSFSASRLLSIAHPVFRSPQMPKHKSSLQSTKRNQIRRFPEGTTNKDISMVDGVPGRSWIGGTNAIFSFRFSNKHCLAGVSPFSFIRHRSPSDKQIYTICGNAKSNDRAYELSFSFYDSESTSISASCVFSSTNIKIKLRAPMNISRFTELPIIVSIKLHFCYWSKTHNWCGDANMDARKVKLFVLRYVMDDILDHEIRLMSWNLFHSMLFRGILLFRLFWFEFIHFCAFWVNSFWCSNN